MLRTLGIGVVAAAVGLVVLVLGARTCDGPLAMIPGGALRSGPEVAAPEDWSFAADVGEIELQLESPPRSRTVWMIVRDGELYIPCAFVDVPGFKQWPHQLAADDRVVLRVEGTRYAGRLARVRDRELHAALYRASGEKYGQRGGDEPDPEALWYFRFRGR